ncbi:MAG: hypothetical protein HWN65_19660 [Candidatus Helarchaeota archaeon]|nr:hypothetical protein [Candidatus Helarchaeota archaeon]
MENERKKGKKWTDRERIVGSLIAFFSASFILTEIMIYSYKQIAWELNIVYVIVLILGGIIGLGNVRLAGILLMIVGLILLISGLIYHFTSNPIFIIYSPWVFFLHLVIPIEGILSFAGGLLLLDSKRRKT